MNYTHLDIYSDLVAEARHQQPLYSHLHPGPQTQQKVRDLLGFSRGDEQPIDSRVEFSWEKDGLLGEEISWSVGYGPRTRAWFFRPANTSGPLPCVLALHDHGGFKFYGKEKIAEGPDPITPVLAGFQKDAYGGRAWVNALAQRGFAVLVHDTFLWGSRKFPLETMQKSVALGIPHQEEWVASQGDWEEASWYNFWAGHHEHIVSKYCNLLGTSMAGIVSHEDRIALSYLRSRPEVDPKQSACMGLSGGGNRAVLLAATVADLKAVAVVGLMSTYEGLLDHNVATHTWMFFPFGLARIADWPDLAACRAPAPLLVQYDEEDNLFTPEGMRAAHKKIMDIYQKADSPRSYSGQFYPGPHKFDIEMQEAAFDWLKERLTA